ncbi:MAG: hypothetical protein ACRC6E_09735 [Fusobacteriaceae bacterium]
MAFRCYTTLDLELINSGKYTIKELASILGRTENGIYAVAVRCNLKYKSNTVTKEEEELILKYKGKKLSEISSITGIGKKRVGYIRTKLGVK